MKAGYDGRSRGYGIVTLSENDHDAALSLHDSDFQGRPLVVRFVFDTALEDPSLRWFGYENLRGVEWTPPQIGEVRRLRGVSF